MKKHGANEYSKLMMSVLLSAQYRNSMDAGCRMINILQEIECFTVSDYEKVT